ncbi:MAG: WG repeat-containing protein [Crocinitomicaceae bacterium]
MKIFGNHLFIISLLFCSFQIHAQKLPDLIPFKQGELYGYCDSNLNVVVKAKYEMAHPFVEDRARVKRNHLRGFIDLNGKEIIPCIHKFATSFLDGYALVGNSQREADYIDKNGQVTSKINYFRDGYPPASGSGRKVEYQNKVGPIKDEIYFYRNQNYQQGYVRIGGDTISGSEFKYPYYAESYSTSDDYDQHFQHFYEGRAVVSGTNGQGHINTIGRLVVDTLYDAAFNFKEGRAKVKLNGKYGFVDKEGNVIGEIKYDQACYFYDGMAQVIIGEKCGYINLKGEEIIPLNYDYWQGERYSSFKEGLVRVRINEKFGILNRKGKVIAEVKYDDINPLFNEFMRVKLNDRFGLIDDQGKEIIPPVYGYLRWLDQCALIFEAEPDSRRYGLINTQGKVVLSKQVNRPLKVDGSGPGIYHIQNGGQGIYFIDKYGTKYIK